MHPPYLFIFWQKHSFWNNDSVQGRRVGSTLIWWPCHVCKCTVFFVGYFLGHCKVISYISSIWHADYLFDSNYYSNTSISIQHYFVFAFWLDVKLTAEAINNDVNNHVLNACDDIVAWLQSSSPRTWYITRDKTHRDISIFTAEVLPS